MLSRSRSQGSRPSRVRRASFLPQSFSSSSSFSSSTSMHVSGISRSVLSITAFSIPAALTKGRGRGRRRGRERLGKPRRGTSILRLRVLSVSKRSINRGHHCYNTREHFLTGFLLASLSNRPRPSSSFSSSASMHVSGVSRSVLSIAAFSIPTALTKGRGRERRRGRERLGKH